MLPDDLESFADRVYWIVQQIPTGCVATYGQVASYGGSSGAARAVGSLMRNSGANGVELPWQRVINASGGITFTGDIMRAELQRELLESEGVTFNRRVKCDLGTHRWEPEIEFWQVD